MASFGLSWNRSFSKSCCAVRRLFNPKSRLCGVVLEHIHPLKRERKIEKKTSMLGYECREPRKKKKPCPNAVLIPSPRVQCGRSQPVSFERLLPLLAVESSHFAFEGESPVPSRDGLASTGVDNVFGVDAPRRSGRRVGILRSSHGGVVVR